MPLPSTASLNRILAALITFFFALPITAASRASWASESGVGTYHNGLVDLLAGYLAPPGTFLAKNYFVYWDASARILTDNREIEARDNVKLYADILQAVYVTHQRFFGADYGLSLLVPIAIAAEQARLSFGNKTPFFRQTSTVGGLGDMIITPMALHWHWDRFHLLSTFSVYAPSGTYDKHRLLNIGRNCWSFEPDVGGDLAGPGDRNRSVNFHRVHSQPREYCDQL